jgi:hypothetical protein
MNKGATTADRRLQGRGRFLGDSMDSVKRTPGEDGGCRKCLPYVGDWLGELGDELGGHGDGLGGLGDKLGLARENAGRTKSESDCSALLT